MRRLRIVCVSGIAIGCVLFGVSIFRDLRWQAATTSCQSGIFQVSYGLHAYNEKHGSLPPAVVYENGVPMHSWRVLLLEVLDPELFNKYRLSEPWNSPHNLSLQEQIPSFYRCPNNASEDSRYATSYVVVTGPNCIFTEGSSVPPRRIEDLDSSLIMLVETKRTDIHWMSPVDLSYEDLSADPQDASDNVIGGFDRNGGHFVVVDSRTQPISDFDLPAILSRLVVPGEDTASRSDASNVGDSDGGGASGLPDPVNSDSTTEN